MSRSLSALESQLILHLEWQKQPVVTIEETMSILSVSNDQARQMLSRLARRRWLALIVPGKCRLRVGNETREWEEGKAWAFDDTIEHEAWNDSDQPRYIFICDIWSPRLSPQERSAIAGVIAATDVFNGTVPSSRL